MSNTDYDDGKLVLSSDEDDVNWNPLSLVNGNQVVRKAVYLTITQRAERYTYNV